MATKTFTGTGTWVTGADWVGGAAATAADDVVITQGATLTINSVVAAKSISDVPSGASAPNHFYDDGNVLTIASGGTLTLSEQLVLAAGTITLSGGTLVNLGTADLSGLTYGNGLVMAGNFNTGAQDGSVSSFIQGFGVIDSTIGFAQLSDGIGFGTIVASGGTLELKQAGIGAGSYSISDSASSVLRLDAAIATGSTISFAGTSGVLFDADAGTSTLAGVTITGFTGSHKISVLGATSYKVLSGGGTTSGTIGALDSGGGTIEVLTVSGAETLSTNTSVITGATLTATAACYLAGTKILTVAGEVSVEDLTVGDLLVTAGAGLQAVRWIGQRAYLARLVNAHHRAGLMPIQISAGALADNVPARDLFVSPEHMMVLDGHLVAAHRLVNGSTITRLEDIDVVKYFHIELDQHSVIFAEGAPSESYLDTGNRNMFTNVLDYAEIGGPVGSTVACLPIVSEGPVLAAIRGVIADRAEANGFTTSADADLHLLVDGAVVYPSMIAGNSYSFDIAEQGGEIRIVSRSVVPAELDAASADRRQLGVAVSVLTLRGNGLSVDVLAGEKLLADGFYPADGGHRWTNGSAQFPTALLALMHGAFSLTVQLVATGLRYPVAGRGDVVALASARGPRVAGDQRRVA